ASCCWSLADSSRGCSSASAAAGRQYSLSERRCKLRQPIGKGIVARRRGERGSCPGCVQRTRQPGRAESRRGTPYSKPFGNKVGSSLKVSRRETVMQKAAVALFYLCAAISFVVTTLVFIAL